MLTLRVPRAEFADALALDNVAPLFWPVLPIRAFAQAVRAAYDWWQTRFLELADAADAAEEAEEVLASRIAAVLTVRPGLAGHFGAALAEVGLIRLAFAPANRDALRPMLVPRPGATLADLAQDAARRFDRLPEGILAFSSPRRPMGCVFQRHMQAMIDAPLVAAEMADERRPPPTPAETLALINLRLVDPAYFDAAMPAAVAFQRETRP